MPTDAATTQSSVRGASYYVFAMKLHKKAAINGAVKQKPSPSARMINDDVINDDENDFFELSNKQITSNVGNADYIDDNADSDDNSDQDSRDDGTQDDEKGDDNDEEKKVLKIEKKKRKFEEMKVKKRSSSHESDPSSSSSGCQSGDAVMTADEMYQMFINNQAVEIITVNNDDILSKSNFYTPNSNAINVAAPIGKNTVNDSGNTAKSAGDNTVKAIMNAIATGMPSYKQTLKGNSNKEGDEEFGSPLVVVLCAGARRAADVINGISGGVCISFLTVSQFIIISTPLRLIQLYPYK